MKDWKERLEDLDDRLATWNAAFAQARAVRLSERGGLMRLFRAPSESQREEAGRAALKDVGEGPHAEVSALFDDLSLYFLEASIFERSKIRAAMGASRALLAPLWGWVLAAADFLRSPEDVDRLRRAVAGIAIDDARVDVDDIWRACGRLWVSASRAGIDPRPVFAEVAAVANRGAGGGGAHMRELLTEFEGSSHFETYVRHEITAA